MNRVMLFGSFPLLTVSMVAIATVVLTSALTPVQAFSGFANASVLLVTVYLVIGTPWRLVVST